MGDLVDTPMGSEGSPDSGGRVSASPFSHHSDEASRGADAGVVSYPAAIADENPFAVALPEKPRRLCKSRDLLGPVPISSNTKAGKAREKCVESNTRLVHAEGLVCEFHKLSHDTHSIAKRSIERGARALKVLKRSHKAAIKERDVSLKSRKKIEAERDILPTIASHNSTLCL